MNEKEKQFHGPDYTQSSWNSKTHVCCLLCKTKNSQQNRTKHWSKGLCRSCYRRLNIKHRLYNDSYSKKPNKNGSKSVKKGYKTLDDLSKLQFSRVEIETLMDRYNWKCAYCYTDLQGYNHKRPNAFQLEYLTWKNSIILLPICRACNCSKKNITGEENLKEWCNSKGLSYPIKIVTVEDYLIS